MMSSGFVNYWWYGVNHQYTAKQL